MWRAPSNSKYLYLKTRGDLHIPTMHTLFLRPPCRRTVLSKPQKSRSRSLVTVEVCYPCRSVHSSEIFGKLKSFYFQADWHQSYEIQRHLSDGKASPSIDRLWIQVAYCSLVPSRSGDLRDYIIISGVLKNECRNVPTTSGAVRPTNPPCIMCHSVTQAHLTY